MGSVVARYSPLMLLEPLLMSLLMATVNANIIIICVWIILAFCCYAKEYTIWFSFLFLFFFVLFCLNKWCDINLISFVIHLTVVRSVWRIVAKLNRCLFVFVFHCFTVLVSIFIFYWISVIMITMWVAIELNKQQRFYLFQCCNALKTLNGL